MAARQPGDCYLTVAYTVEGADLRFNSSHGGRWCAYRDAYRRDTYVPVYYGSSNPDRATLAPRGTLPMASVAIGLVGLATCGAYCVRRSRRSDTGARVGVA